VIRVSEHSRKAKYSQYAPRPESGPGNGLRVMEGKEEFIKNSALEVPADILVEPH
jgi:hypothetical protein